MSDVISPVQEILPPGRFRHYKGRDYEVFGVTHHSESREPLVVYRCLYGDYSLWVRPLAMFQEAVQVGGETIPRFRYVEPMGAANPLTRLAT